MNAAKQQTADFYYDSIYQQLLKVSDKSVKLKKLIPQSTFVNFTYGFTKNLE